MMQRLRLPLGALCRRLQAPARPSSRRGDVANAHAARGGQAASARRREQRRAADGAGEVGLARCLQPVAQAADVEQMPARQDLGGLQRACHVVNVGVCVSTVDGCRAPGASSCRSFTFALSTDIAALARRCVCPQCLLLSVAATPLHCKVKMVLLVSSLRTVGSSGVDSVPAWRRGRWRTARAQPPAPPRPRRGKCPAARAPLRGGVQRRAPCGTAPTAAPGCP